MPSGAFISHSCAVKSHKRTKLLVQGMHGNLPAATHYTLQRHTSVVKGPRHPLCVISTSVKLWSARVITLPWLFTPYSSMKAILRDREVGARCEGEVTPKGENTGNVLERRRVGSSMLLAFCALRCIQQSTTPWLRSETDSWPQQTTRCEETKPNPIRCVCNAVGAHT